MVNKYIGSLLSIRHACLKTLFRVQMRTHLGYFPVGTFGFLFHLCFPQTFLVFLKDVRRLGSNSYLCRPEPLQLVPVPAPFCFLEGKGVGGCLSSSRSSPLYVAVFAIFLQVLCFVCHLFFTLSSPQCPRAPTALGFKELFLGQPSTLCECHATREQ